ncbi:protein translocase subunit secE/sec61 gamma [Paraperlucidibaca baekdonensis]|uniref:Protein translocase subunit SecE n=1 Tax=Paraperlucidibaca baekdonensis TaxID=748120 RepID=A0A3E0H6I1_9GAMM|nr:preprotein translocase subunit SecE [Paraperlucidibaca baekdonensis]REH38624.1 protein translocase subunit secE/sec61 gamma [Paraperlucidibaca baekdonensis]
MTTPVETVRDPLNTIKWVVALVLLASATVLSRYLPDMSPALRLLMMLGLGLVALVLVFTTIQGRRFVDLLRQAQVEVRKVVWPTRPETTQTTLIVLGVVLVMSLLLWGMDSLFGFAISGVIG